MKVIQIKYCSPTNTKGTRWKVWAKDTAVRYFPRDYKYNHDNDATLKAGHYAVLQGWNHPITMGILPNGDYVAVLG